jgi:hypothetical protein
MAVAASYNWTDVENAADVNAVNWAFTGSGDKPGGYPTSYPDYKGDGKPDSFSSMTVSQEKAQASNGSSAPVMAESGDLSQAVQVVNELQGAPQQYVQGEQAMLYRFADGSYILVTGQTSGSTVTTTTTIYRPDGSQVRSFTQTSAVTAQHEQQTTRVEKQGDYTVTTVVTKEPDGSETITTTITGKDPKTGKEVVLSTSTTKVDASSHPSGGTQGPIQQAEQAMNSDGSASMVGYEGPGY